MDHDFRPIGSNQVLLGVTDVCFADEPDRASRLHSPRLQSACSEDGPARFKSSSQHSKTFGPVHQIEATFNLMPGSLTGCSPKSMTLTKGEWGHAI